MTELADLERQQIAQKIHNAIDDYDISQRSNFKGHRLPLSKIGEECARSLYYDFRWARTETMDARMTRFLKRGNDEEARWIEKLRAIGFEVWDLDPNAGDRARNKQFKVRACRDHAGGFLDGVGQSLFAPMPMLLEFKFISTGPFGKIVSQGVQKQRPLHWAQMCSYGRAYDLKYALYFVNNRNDDDINVQCLELDWKLADDLLRKADEIITAKRPPARIAESPTYLTCKFCKHSDHCHGNAPVDKSCRTCEDASPIDAGKWHCAKWNATIPYDAEEKGCDAYRAMLR